MYHWHTAFQELRPSRSNDDHVRPHFFSLFEPEPEPELPKRSRFRRTPLSRSINSSLTLLNCW